MFSFERGPHSEVSSLAVNLLLSDVPHQLQPTKMSTIEGSPQPEVAQVKVKKSKRARETAPPPSSTSAIASEELSFSIQPPSDDSPSAPVAIEATAEDEVPALSHKEKRLAKRRKLSGLDPLPTPAASSSTSTATSGVPGIVIGNTPSKSAHGIWLGNMNYGTTSKMLLSWFEERGLKDVTRINMPNGKRPGENNRGCVPSQSTEEKGAS